MHYYYELNSPGVCMQTEGTDDDFLTLIPSEYV